MNKDIHIKDEGEFSLVFFRTYLIYSCFLEAKIHFETYYHEKKVAIPSSSSSQVIEWAEQNELSYEQL